MTIYIDIILLENIIMNYIIILTTSIICKTKIKQIRFILASTIGAIYAVILYITNMKILNNEIFKILLSILINFVAYNPASFKQLIQNLLIFFLTSFCFGGASFYILHSNIIDKNILLGNYQIKVAIIGGIIGFVIINISFKMLKRKITKKDLIYVIEIFYKEKRKKIKVLLDTGNLLKDPITNVPVAIIEKSELEEIVPKEILENINNISNCKISEMNPEISCRCSIIPFSSIGKNNGIILGFRPDFIKIYNNDNEIEKKIIIGIYDEKISKNNLYSGLIGLNILN